MGLLLQTLPLLAVSFLHHVVFEGLVFRLNEIFGAYFQMLFNLLCSMIHFVFLFYWLNRYTNENIRKIGEFRLFRSIGFSLLLIVSNYLSGVIQRLLLSGVPDAAWRVKPIIRLVLSLLFYVFVWMFVFYKALGLPKDLALRYKPFMSRLFRFVREKISLILAEAGACLTVAVLIVIILFKTSLIWIVGIDDFSLADSFPDTYIAANVVMIVTFIVPFTTANLFAAFAEFFCKEAGE